MNYTDIRMCTALLLVHWSHYFVCCNTLCQSHGWLSLHSSPRSTSTYPRGRRKHINNGGYHCSLSLPISRAHDITTIPFKFVMSLFFTLCANICKLVELILWNSEANIFKLSFFMSFLPPCVLSISCLRFLPSVAVWSLNFCLRSHVTLYGVYGGQSATVTSFSPRNAFFFFCCHCQFSSLSNLYQLAAPLSKTQQDMSVPTLQHCHITHTHKRLLCV